MKQGKITGFRKFLIYAAVIFSFSINAFASGMPATDFWFALPHVVKPNDDTFIGETPYYLSLHSDLGASVHIVAGDTTLLNKKVNIKAGETVRVYLAESLMNKDIEQKKSKGIHLFSDRPISATLFTSYQLTGEAFRLIPVEYLGKRYMTLNLYEDKTDILKSPQILIVATEDNTKVTYTAQVKTSKAEPGESYSVTLNKGESYLLEIYENPSLFQDWASDLSGTYIESTKPVAVISGHVKGAFPRQNPTSYGLGADFMRNLLVEMLLPYDFLGSEYVSAPLFYNKRSTGIVQDDRGDLIRFVALFDSTVIYKYKSDGSGLSALATIYKKGSHFDILSQDKAEYYKTSKTALVGQYGKAWIASIPPPKTKKQADMPLSPVETGQGMLLALLPVSFWQNYANFESIEGLDNFLYMTFKSADAGSIYFDGEAVNSIFYTSMTAIKNTDYSYVMTKINPGAHKISTNGSGRFAAYPYGNKDGTSNSYAYGYTAAFDYYSDCNDSIVYFDTVKACGSYSALIQSVNLDSDTCGTIMSLISDADSTYNFNMSIDTKVTGKHRLISLQVADITKPAKIIVRAIAASGRMISRTYEYLPENLTTKNTTVDFGDFAVGDTNCKTIYLVNSGNSALTINSLNLSNPEYFHVSGLTMPVSIPAKDSIPVELCATIKAMPASQPVTGSLVATLSCFSDTTSLLTFKTGERDLSITDVRWQNIEVGSSRNLPLGLTNKSKYPVTINSIDWADKSHFDFVEEITLPQTIAAMGSVSFNVKYSPDKADVVDSTRAIFNSNATKSKLFSDWVGSSRPTGIEELTADNCFTIDQNTPNPVSGVAAIAYNSGRYAQIRICLYNSLGQKVADLVNAPHPSGNYSLSININDLGLSEGVYFYSLESGSVRLTKALTVIR